MDFKIRKQYKTTKENVQCSPEPQLSYTVLQPTNMSSTPIDTRFAEATVAAQHSARIIRTAADRAHQLEPINIDAK